MVPIAPFKSDYEILELATAYQRIDFAFHHRPVSSVGRALDYRAGGRGCVPQTGPTLRSEENVLPLYLHLQMVRHSSLLG